MDEADGAAADEVPFVRAARFVRVDPAKNHYRFYELRLQETLWGGVALVRAWGRLGAPGRSAITSYPDPAAAMVDVERAVRRRRRGYRLVAAHGVPEPGHNRAPPTCPPAATGAQRDVP